MPFPGAEGALSNSGLSIPEIWTRLQQVDYYHTSVLPRVSNTRWQGEIKKMGDKVHIRWRPTAQIGRYYDEMELPLQMLTTQVTELLIDQGFFYNFAEGIVSQFQSDIALMAEASKDAAEQMRQQVETEVFSYVFTEAHSQNMGATAGKNGNINLGATGAPLVITPSNVVGIFSRMKQVLNHHAVPTTGRYAVIDEELGHVLRMSDLKFADLTGDAQSLIRSDMLGRVHGFDVYTSDHLAYTTDGSDTVANGFFGHPDGLTFASQFVKTEMKPREKQFGERMAGLHVYGRKVTQPKAVGHLYYKVA